VVAEHYAELDAGFTRLLDSLAGSGTTVIVTADHGFVDIADEQGISLDAHPVMKAGYVIQDPIPGEKPPQMIGFHGGLSEKEMYVPFICASI